MNYLTLPTLLAAFLVLSPAIFWYGLVEPFEPLKAALAQLVALTVFVTAGWRWSDLRRLFAGPVGLAVAVAVASAVLSTVFSTNMLLSLLGDSDSHDGLGHAVALAVIFAASREVGAKGNVLAASAFGLTLACGYALVQAAGLDPLVWDQTSEFYTWRRPAGTLGHPTYIAGYAVMALPLLAWRFSEGGWRVQFCCAMLAVAAGLVVVATLSRGPWLAGVAALAVVVALWPGRKRVVWVGALAVLAGAGICLCLGGDFLRSLSERLGTLASSPGRRPVWLAAWRVFLDYPWLGSGLDTFGLAFTWVRTPEYWQVEWGLLPRRAHNDLLHVLATRGVVGGVAYVGLGAALVVTCVRAWRRQPERRRLVAALLGVVVAFYVQNVFGFAVAGTAGLFAVVAGTVAAFGDELSPMARRECPPNVSRFPGLDLLRFTVALPLVWLVITPVVASAMSRRADRDPSWHALAVRLAPWHEVFHSRRYFAAMQAAEHEPTPERKRARYEEARGAAAEACRLNPLRARHHADHGRALAELARIGMVGRAEALAAFDRAIALDPCDSLTFADAARAATALGRAEEAEFYSRRGLAADPEFGPLHAELGTAYLSRATRSVPSDAALLVEAEAMLRVAMTKQWHEEAERFDRARLMLALALVQRGETADALVHAENVRRGRPDWPSAAWLCGVALERGGHRDEALRAYRDTLRRWPDNPQAVAGVARLAR